MGAFSIWHWLVLILWIANIFFTGRVIWRMGFHPLWVIPLLVPLLETFLLWFAAYKPWPSGSPRWRGGTVKATK